MKRIEKEIKRISAKRIDESLPPIPVLDNKGINKRRPFVLPLLLAPVGVAAIVIAIAIPLSSRPNKPSYQYIENRELVSNFGDYTSGHSEEVQPALTFNLAIKGNYEMALVHYEFDAAKCDGKIALTLSKEGVDALSFVKKEGKWRTIESDIINMYGGCIIEYDVVKDLRCVHFDLDEKVPCQIDERYVVALYYEGKSTLVEELTKGIEGPKEKREYYSISASEGEDGFLVENIPEPYTNDFLYAGYALLDKEGKFAVRKINERYARVASLRGDTLMDAGHFFYELSDPLGEISSLLVGRTINYEEFKRVLPNYIDFYQSDEFKSAKEVPFSQYTYEVYSDQEWLGKICYVFRSQKDLNDYGSGEIIVKYHPVDDAFFENNALLVISGWNGNKNYDLDLKSIILKEGFLTVNAEMKYVSGKLGHCFCVAEISKQNIKTLEYDHVLYNLKVVE